MPSPRMGQGGGPAAPIKLVDNVTTTGTQTSFGLGKPVTVASLEIKGGKTAAINLQGSVTGKVWQTLSTSTSTTAGRLVKINWSTSATLAPATRIRAIVKTLGAGSTGVSAWLAV